MITALIVDDEPLAIKALQSQLEDFPEVDICETASSALEAVKLIKKLKPQLLFLDVNLQDDTGFDVLECITGLQVAVIFTTAHEEYALKAIKVDAVDFLLKPIDFDDLTSSIEKVKKLFSTEMAASQHVAQKGETELAEKLAIPTKDGHTFIDIRDILYIQADSSYSTIFLENQKTMLVSRRLKAFEDSLSTKEFVRAHKSHLVNLRHIQEIKRSDGHYLIMKDGTRLNISRANREALTTALNAFIKSI